MTLLSNLREECVQLGLGLVDELCRLTGMKLNVQKTHAFSTQPKYRTTLKVGDETLGTVSELVIGWPREHPSDAESIGCKV
ncbi:hypothetical protein DIPPA_16421 [Diplonema papillatum]|nr:hypothetical protein DIPPA_16421 [Diplonema papillatum]